MPGSGVVGVSGEEEVDVGSPGVVSAVTPTDVHVPAPLPLIRPHKLHVEIYNKKELVINQEYLSKYTWKSVKRFWRRHFFLFQFLIFSTNLIFCRGGWRGDMEE